MKGKRRTVKREVLGSYGGREDLHLCSQALLDSPYPLQEQQHWLVQDRYRWVFCVSTGLFFRRLNLAQAVFAFQHNYLQSRSPGPPRKEYNREAAVRL